MAWLKLFVPASSFAEPCNRRVKVPFNPSLDDHVPVMSNVAGSILPSNVSVSLPIVVSEPVKTLPFCIRLPFVDFDSLPVRKNQSPVRSKSIGFLVGVMVGLGSGVKVGAGASVSIAGGGGGGCAAGAMEQLMIASGRSNKDINLNLLTMMKVIPYKKWILDRVINYRGESYVPSFCY